ncbi:hypothetical protein FACS1894147_02790 [Spirochaetia bacterium]|nr:hypothetical protein FACS1894147_02790 [Spirochaetia bacterium]
MKKMQPRKTLKARKKRGNGGSLTFLPLVSFVFFVVLFLFPGLLPVSLYAQSTTVTRLAVIPENPRPGEPVTVAILTVAILAAGADGAGLQAVLVNSSGRLAKAVLFDLAAAPGETPLKAALLTVPSTARPGGASVRIESAKGVLGEMAITISPRDFVSEEIALDQSNTAIVSQPDPQKTAEANQLAAILNRTGVEVYASGTFVPPVTSTRRTSFFGDRRVYRYVSGGSSTSIHGGVDYGVPKGTSVAACADGKVVFAGFRIVTGNSVILEHFPGVYSLYYHLDKIEVLAGAMVKTGSLLGFSGSTGLSTGPHLHWEIRVAGENTDPDAFVARAVLDKAALLGKINSGP